MLIHCKKTGRMYDVNLEFQRELKDAWTTSVLKHTSNAELQQPKQTDNSAVKINNTGEIVHE